VHHGHHGFEALLDSVGGASAYLKLRAKLVAYGARRWRGSADDVADEALARIEAQLAGGAPVRDVTRYAFGVAKRVALEAVRRWRREHGRGECPDAIALERDGEERDPACVLARLPADDRALLVRYGAARGAARRALADELGINVNALRIRVHRARRRLRTLSGRDAHDLAVA
jgi:RNA polymerase sigma-70 factor (ECF subfamily)